MNYFLVALAIIVDAVVFSIALHSLMYFFLERGHKWLGLLVPMIPVFLMLWFILWLSGV